MVEINTYYDKKYAAYTQIVKVAILFCIPIIFLAVLMRLQLLPDAVVMICVICIVAVGIIVVGNQMYELSRRSNTNFDEYNWEFNADDMKDSLNRKNILAYPAFASSLCMNGNCCGDKTSWNGSVCVPKENFKNFTPLISRVDKKHFNSDSIHPYTTNNSYGVL
jgi:hypothetical protein